jgi:hypothetical protein
LTNINSCTPTLCKPDFQVGIWHSPIGDIPAPTDRDAYCKMRYGPNWRTPSNKKGIYNGQF